MKVFCLLARREIAANRKAFFWIAVTMAASFLLGETISLCVTAGSGQVEYGSMGAIFAGIFGVIVACVMIGMQFSQGFGFAVKMGVSRRRYLAGAFAAAFALMIFALAGTALLQGLDWLVVKLAMPELRYAFHLLTVLPWYATIGAVLGICITGVALSAAAGAFLLRFGKPFFAVLWIVWMGLCFLTGPVARILSKRDMSTPVSAALVTLFDALARLPGWFWMALIPAAIAGCYLAAVHILKKQPVTM